MNLYKLFNLKISRVSQSLIVFLQFNFILFDIFYTLKCMSKKLFSVSSDYLKIKKNKIIKTSEVFLRLQNLDYIHR